MQTAQILERFEKLRAAESKLPLKQFWCSMADPNLPEGSQFLGVAIVEAQGAATATCELNVRGLNLGGEICFVEIPAGVRIPAEWMNRVLSKQEAEKVPINEVES